MNTAQPKDMNALDTVLLLKAKFPAAELHTISTHHIVFSLRYTTTQEEQENDKNLSALSLSCGWFLSTRPSLTGFFRYGIERIKMPQAKARYLFHAAKRADRASIQANGLRPSRIATTFTHRTYPSGRLHFAKSLHGVLAFYRSTLTNDLANAGRVISGDDLLASIAGIDVWSVSNASARLVCVDAFMENSGVWSTEAVLPTDLSLVPDLNERATEIIDLVDQGTIAW